MKKDVIAKTEGEYEEQQKQFEVLLNCVYKMQKVLLDLNKVPKEKRSNVLPEIMEMELTPMSLDLYMTLNSVFEDVVSVMRVDFEVEGV